MASQMGDEAYVTLITSDDFFPGVQVLAYSLQEGGTTRPLVVLVTEQVSTHTKKRLAQLGEVIVVDRIPAPGGGTHVEGWADTAYTKLHVFGLTQWRKLVYIDADCMAVRNVDELFLRPHLSFAPDVFPPDAFNAGVMVVEPSAELFADLCAKAATLPSHDGGDTGFLNAAFPDWWQWGPEHRLPFRFNAQRMVFWFTAPRTRGYWDRVDPAIIHYSSSPKPWEPSAKRGELEVAWWETFTRSQLAPLAQT